MYSFCSFILLYTYDVFHMKIKLTRYRFENDPHQSSLWGRIECSFWEVIIYHSMMTPLHVIIWYSQASFEAFYSLVFHSFLLDGYILLPFFELLILQLSIIQFTKTIHLKSLLTVMGIQGIMYESDIKNSITRRSTFEYFFPPLCLDVFSVLRQLLLLLLYSSTY